MYTFGDNVSIAIASELARFMGQSHNKVVVTCDGRKSRTLSWPRRSPGRDLKMGKVNSKHSGFHYMDRYEMGELDCPRDGGKPFRMCPTKTVQTGAVNGQQRHAHPYRR